MKALYLKQKREKGKVKEWKRFVALSHRFSMIQKFFYREYMSLQPSWPEWERGEAWEIVISHGITSFPPLNHLVDLLKQEWTWNFWNSSRDFGDVQQEVWETKIEDEGLDEDGDYFAQ
jgi:hypothetical protein